MKAETAKMIEEKSRFIRSIETLLSMDDRNSVDSLKYFLELQDDNGDCYDEYVDIVYPSGMARRLLVTGNSNAANLKAIIKEVY